MRFARQGQYQSVLSKLGDIAPITNIANNTPAFCPETTTQFVVFLLGLAALAACSAGLPQASRIWYKSDIDLDMFCQNRQSF